MLSTIGKTLRTLPLHSKGRRQSSIICQMNNHPNVSERILQTNDPVIMKTKNLTASVPGCVSLAQGIVHWHPPTIALERGASMMKDPSSSAYGPDEGMPALREALRKKLYVENGLSNYDVHVTAGANQAFTNLAVALLDPQDEVVLFLPFYFNHRMAIQMTGGGDNIIYGPSDPISFHPDLDWLEQTLNNNNDDYQSSSSSSSSSDDEPNTLGKTVISLKKSSRPPKMVVIVNPNNPTGVNMTKEELERASEICKQSGSWLVIDNTYEHFVYGDSVHTCVGAPHIIHLFSFSKAFGMMGFRQGYIAYFEDGSGSITSQLVKVQDTNAICATQLSQHVSLGALEAGRTWVKERVTALENENRKIVLEALEPLGSPGNGIAPSEGAIYLWAKLPDCCWDDELVLEWLVKKHKVCVIPGSSCGCPGYIRVAFANLLPEECAEAAKRLRVGLEELVEFGIDGVKRDLLAL